MRLSRRKWIKTAAGLVLPAWAAGGATIIIAPPRYNKFGVSFETETLDWVTRTQGFSSDVDSGPKNWVDTFVKAAKTNGYFSKAYRIGVYLSNSFAGLQAPLVAAAGGSTDQTVNFVSGDYSSTGLVGSLSASKHISTQLYPNSSISNATTDFSIGCYIRAGDTGGKIMIGAQVSGDASRGLYIYRDGTNTYLSCFNNATQVSFSDGGSGGYYMGTLGASNALKLYKNGTQVASGSGSVGTAPNVDIYVHDGNLGGLGPQWAPTAQSICFYWIGKFLTGTEVSDQYTDVQAMQTSASRQV